MPARFVSWLRTLGPTLTAHNPGGIPAFSRGEKPARKLATGQIMAPFGSPRGGGGRPKSTRFPRAAAPHLLAPGAVPRLSSRRRTSSRGRKGKSAARPPSPPLPVLPGELRRRPSSLSVRCEESCAAASHYRPLRCHPFGDLRRQGGDGRSSTCVLRRRQDGDGHPPGMPSLFLLFPSC